MSTSGGKPRPRSARTQITVIMLGLLLPAFAYSGYLIAHHANGERKRYHAQAVEVAQRTAAAVDRELARQLLVVKVLAASPLVRDGRLQDFYREAVEAKRITGSEIVVKNDLGHHLINTRRPWAPPIPAGLTETDRRALQSGEPAISDLYASSLTGAQIVSLSVATRLGSIGQGLVNIGLSPPLLRELLLQQGLPEEWTTVIIDGNDRIIARSRRHEQFFGQVATEDLRRNAVGTVGVWSGTTLEGAPVLSAYARSQVAPGWRVAVGVPNAAFEDPLRQSLISLVMVGLATLTGAVTLAGWYGERLARGLGRLAHSAAHIGEGKPLVREPSSVREIDDVDRALSVASVDLQDRTRALAENEQRLLLTLEAGKMGAWDWSLASGDVYLDEMGCRLWGVEPSTGKRPVEQFFALVDPRDIAMLKEDLSVVIERHTPYNREFRIRHGNGEVRWLAGRGIVISDEEQKPTRMIGVNFDITESRLTQERTAELLAELNHRVKNSLAVLDAIANRTMLDASTKEAFFEAFTGRLSALASSHALLSETGWQGVEVGRLVESQTAPYAGSDKGRIHCTGPVIQLGSDLSLALAFVLHELATNAAKHGALSVPTGRLEVSWERALDDGRDILELTWAERGGPPVQPPTRQGYGSRLIAQSLGYTFKGTVTQHFEPHGLTTRIRVPLA